MSTPSAAPKTVLLVEDDATVRDTVIQFLEREGFIVAAAEDGRQALQFLRRNDPPSCIILDLLMPVMDGWEFRAHQLADAALASIPVVIITALTEEGRRTPEVRGLPILPKPFRMDQLIEVVRSIGT